MAQIESTESGTINDRLLTTEDLMARYQKHRRTIWSWVKNGHLPKPIKRGNSNYWLTSEILEKDLSDRK